MADLPRLFYVCDFPPANRGGGDTLLLRLLEGYPSDSLFIAASHRRMDALAEGPFRQCKQLGIHEFTGKKRHGMAQFLLLLDRLLIPLHALRLAWHARRWKAQVVLTVAHGYLFLAAHLCAAICRLPVVMIVHDDWVATELYFKPLRPFRPALFRWALQRSEYLYAVSAAMAQYLKNIYEAQSEIQYPATPRPHTPPKARVPSLAYHPYNRPIRILYAGLIHDSVFDAIDFLAQYLIRRATSKATPPIQLHLHSPLTQTEINAFGWITPVIQAKPWLNQRDLQHTLTWADILFLPVTFNGPAHHYAITSFPSKLADYLASGTPILTIAPPYAEVVAYLDLHQCAAIVSVREEALLDAVFERLFNDPLYPATLSLNALQTYEQNHNALEQRRAFYDRLSLVAQSHVTTCQNLVPS